MTQVLRNVIGKWESASERTKASFREEDFTGLGAGLHETEAEWMD
jgi:hypothetical protein